MLDLAETRLTWAARVVSDRSRNMTTQFYLTLISAFGVICSTASADIIIDVAGELGSGTTRWTFSGSATVEADPGGSSSISIDDNDANVSRGWNVGSAFYSGSDVNIDFTSTTTSFTSDGTVYDILGVGANVNMPADWFGIAIDSAAMSSSYSFPAGTDLTAFFGVGLAPVDVGEFTIGITDASVWGINSATPQGSLRVGSTFRLRRNHRPSPVS